LFAPPNRIQLRAVGKFQLRRRCRDPGRSRTLAVTTTRSSDLNTKVVQFPSNLIAGMFGIGPRNFSGCPIRRSAGSQVSFEPTKS
jgi:hypothetical protein